MSASFAVSFSQTLRGVTIFVVEDEDGAEHSFKSAVSANKAFPGAFDEPDSDEE